MKERLNKTVIEVSILVVTSRFLSFIMALIISSPACWCCVPVAPVHEVKQTAASHSCCHSKSANSAEHKQNHDAPGHSSSSKDKDCPCLLSQVGRDKTEHQVAVPVIAWAIAAPELWLSDKYIFGEIERGNTFTVHENTGQRIGHLPIYQQHCSMLI